MSSNKKGWVGLLLLFAFVSVIAAPEIVTDETRTLLIVGEQHDIGDLVVVRILKPITGLTISNNVESFRFLGNPEGNIAFTPRRNGTYTVRATIENTTTAITFEVGGIIFEYEENEPVENLSTTLKELVSVLNSKKENVSMRALLRDGEGKSVEFTRGVFDMEVTFMNSSIERIEFRDIIVDETLELGVDELNESAYVVNGSTPEKMYAIDPTNLAFVDATVTATARGNRLMKCAAWNFTAQRCEGDWVHIQNITPGAPYSFILTAADPAFAEIFDTNEAFDVDMAALDNTTLVIAFMDAGTGNHASFEIWDTNGTQLVNEVDLETSGDLQSRIAVEPINTTQFALVIVDGPSNDLDLYIYNRDGTQEQGTTQIDPNVGTNSDVGICQLGDRFVVANANDADNDADYEIWSNAGTNLVGESNVDGSIVPGALRQNLVDCAAVNETHWVYAYFDDGSNDATIASRTNTGATVSGQVDLDTNIGETGQVAATGLRNDLFVVAFYDSTDDDITITVRRPAGTGFTTILANTDIDTNAGTSSRVSVAEVEAQGESMFVVGWQDTAAGDIKAAVYNATGTQVTAPFTITTTPDATFPLLDVVGTTSLVADTGLCNETFAIAYTNTTNAGVFETYYVNGTRWDGICDHTPPTVILNDPANTAELSSSTVEFNFTVTDNRDSIMPSCRLYTNFTGSWAINRTITNVIGGVETNITVHNVDEGTWVWNVECSDSRNNVAFAPANRTFLMNNITPAITNGAINVTEVNQSHHVLFNSTIQDPLGIHTALITLLYPDGAQENFTLTRDGNFSTVIFTNTTIAGEHNITLIWANDTHGQVGQNTSPGLSFLVTLSPPSAFNLLTPTNDTVSANLQPNFTWEAVQEETFDNYTILIDKQENFTSPDFTYHNFNTVTNTSRVISALDANSVYYWKVIAYDTFGSSTNSTNYFRYTTNIDGPSVTLNKPLNATFFNSPLSSFNYTATDLNDIDNCTLYHNASGTFEANVTNTTVNNGNPSFINTEFPEGVYLWSVECTDEAGNPTPNFNANNRTVIVDLTPPSIVLISPDDEATENTTNNVVFTANTTDEMASVESCDLIIFSTIQQTEDVTDGVVFNFTEFLVNSDYNWSVNCTDVNNHRVASEERSLTVNVNDTNPPLITLNDPDDNVFVPENNISFNYTPEDATGVADCNFFIDNVFNATCGFLAFPSNRHAESGQALLATSATSIDTDLTNTYNQSRAFIRAYFHGNEPPSAAVSLPPNENLGITYFLDDNTVRSQRYAGTNSLGARATWSILQADNLRVCPFSNTWAASDVNDDVSIASCDYTLPANYNQKCFIETHMQTRVNSADVDCTQTGYVLANITNITNVNLQRSAGDTGCAAAPVAETRGYVVCFQDTSVVTSGYIDANAIGSGTNFPIGTTVNTSNSFLTFNHLSTNDGLEQNSLRGQILNSTHLLFDRTSDASTAGTVSVHWYVTQFETGKGGFVENQESLLLGNTLTQTDVTFTNEFGTNHSLLWCSHNYDAGEGTAYSRVPWTFQFVDNTTARANRGRTGGTGQNPDLHCQGIRWPGFSSFDSTGDACLIENRKPNYFNVTSIPEGFHNWSVTCRDNTTNLNIGVSATQYFTVDITNPVVTLNSPSNNSFVFVPTVEFNYTPNDTNLANCTLYGNFSGSWAADFVNLTPIDEAPNFFVKTLSDGSHGWNILCMDLSGKHNFAVNNFTVNVDTTPPNFSGNRTDPVSPTTYVQGQLYHFNITWTDDTGVHIVTIQHNFTGTLVNQTIVSPGNDIYNFTIADLPAGIYRYKWFANDTQGSTNQTIDYTYVINRAQTILNLTLNGIDGDISIDEDTLVNKTGELFFPGTGLLLLFQDGVLINSGNVFVTNTTDHPDPITYNITLVYNETQNYTRAEETHFIVANDTTPPVVTLISPENNVTVGTVDVVFQYNVSDFGNVDNCSLFINGTLNQTNTSIVTDTTLAFFFTLEEQDYNWSVSCYDDDGNLGESVTNNFTVVDSTVISINVSTPKNIYIRGEIANATTITKDIFGNDLVTNLTIDVILAAATTTKTPWWNTSWALRKPIVVTENLGIDRFNLTIEVSVTGLGGNITTCVDEARVVDATTLTPLAVNVIGGDDDTFCTILFEANITGNATGDLFHFYYNNSGASDPSHPAIERTITLMFEDFGDSTGTGGWAATTGTCLIPGPDHACINNTPWGAFTNCVDDGDFELCTTDDGAVLSHNPNDYALTMADMDAFDAARGLFFELDDGTTFCDGSVCEQINVSFSFSASGLDAGEFCRVWANDDDTTDAEIYQCNNAEACEANDATPDPADYTAIGDVDVCTLTGISCTGNNLDIYLGGQATVNGDRCFWDNFNVEGFKATNSNLSVSIGAKEEHIERELNITDIDGTHLFMFDTIGHIPGNYSTVVKASKQSFDDAWNATSFEVVQDVDPPSITLHTPVNNTITSNATLRFNWTANDLQRNQTCNLTLNGIVNTSNIFVENGINVHITMNLSEGPGSWNVTCWDRFGNNATSETRIFEIAIDPSSFDLLLPVNGTVSSNLQPNMSWEATADESFYNYTLLLDKDAGFGSLDFEYHNFNDVTNTSRVVDFALDANSIYFWRVVANDIFGNSINSTNDFVYITDTIGPTVVLNTPLNGTFIITSPGLFNYTANDTHTIDNCTLYHNASGNFEANVTNTTVNNSNPSFINTPLPDGVYVWSVECTDEAGVSTPNFNANNRTVIVDLTPPIITLVSPANNTLENETNNIVFIANTTDAHTGIASCELIVNNQVEQTDTSITEGVEFNFTEFLNNNVYLWSINCTDDNGFEGASFTYNLSVLVVDNDPPLITLNDPLVNAYRMVTNISFNFTPEDATGIENCSIYLDGVVNQTCGRPPGPFPTQVQAESGEAILTTSTTSTDTDLTNTYNQSRAFIRAYFHGNVPPSAVLSLPPNENLGITYFLDDNTVRSQRYAGTNSLGARATWSILQADNLRVCPFSNTWAASDVNDDVSIASCDYNLPNEYNQKCFIEVRSRVSSSDVDCTQAGFVLANITSITNVNLQRSAGDTGCAAAPVAETRGYVVCFQDNSVVTSGYIDADAIGNGTLYEIGTVINTTNSFLSFNYLSTDDGLEQNSLRGQILNSTHLLFDRTSDASTTGTVSVYWYIVTFETGAGGFSENQEALLLSETTTATNLTFTNEFTLNNSLLWCSDNYDAGEGTAYPRVPWAYQFVDNITAQANRGRIGTAGQDPDLHCQAILWPNQTSFDGTDSRCKIINQAPNFFNISNIAEGLHDWSVECTDNTTQNNTGSSITINFTIDLTDPIVTLNTPLNGTFSPATVFFNYTPNDTNLQACLLYGNFSGTWAIQQTNSSPRNLVPNNFTQTLPDGIFVWNVLCNDSSGRQNFAPENFTVQVDTTPPNFSGNRTDPVSPAIYASGQLYHFNITWTDSNGVDTVLFEHNFTGTLVNITLVSPGNDIYNFTIIDLPAGTYRYGWYANDTEGNTNQTQNYTYIVDKAPTVLNLTLNSTEGTIVINEDGDVNITAVLITPSIGVLQLYEDGVLINNGSSPLDNVTTYVNPGFVNITAVYETTTNYTRAEITYFIILNDITPPNITLLSPENNSFFGSNDVTFQYNVSDESTIDNCSLFINATLNQTDTSITVGIPQSFFEFLSDGSYNWSVQCYDNASNLGFSHVYNLSVLKSDIIIVNTTTDKSLYEKGEIVNVSTHTKDVFGNDLPTNITLDIIKAETNYTWWDTDWQRRKPVLVTNQLQEHRENIILTVNVTGLAGNISSCANEIRVIDVQTNSPVVANIIGGDDNRFCTINFLANVSAGVVDEELYHVYYNNSEASNPGFGGITRNINIMFENFNDSTGTGGWATTTGTCSTPDPNFFCVNNTPYGNFDECLDGGDWLLCTTDDGADLTHNPNDYALRMQNMDGFNGLLGLISNITNTSVACGGYPCEEINFRFEFSASGLDAGEFCRVWVGDNNAINTSLFQCSNGDSCEANDATPEPPDYGLVGPIDACALSGINCREPNNYLNTYLGGLANGNGDVCFWDNFNISGVVATNPNITTTIEEVQLHILRNLSETAVNARTSFLWDTHNETLGDYSAVALAQRANFSNGTGAAMFEIVADTTAPNITLLAPPDLFESGAGLFNFTYFVRDPNLDSCILYVEDGGFNQIETNSTPTNNANNSFLNHFFGIGIRPWNVECNDTEGNIGFAPANFTLNITAPDLIITTGNITFSSEPRIEGVNITIFANITNIGLTHANDSFIVEFWSGIPGVDGEQINGNITVPELNISHSILLNVSYILKIGTNQIFVRVDPANTTTEADENNNNATRNLTVPQYQVFYGNISSGIILDTFDNQSFQTYGNLTQSTGHIFVADTDSVFSFLNLNALTRTEGGSPTGNDFTDIDTNLNTSTFNDSIQEIWGGGTNTPLQTADLNISGFEIENVPYVNSTNTSSFFTGILWDTTDDDSANDQYDTTDQEDIVFVTSINQSHVGEFGTYDYEIKVPSRLSLYQDPTDTVTFYFEIE